MKKTIVIFATLVSFIAASLAIINFVSDYDIIENFGEFIKGPGEYIKKSKKAKQEQQVKQIAKKQVDFYKKQQEEVAKRRAIEEEKKRKAREEETRKTLGKKTITSSKNAKTDRRLFETPQESEVQTLIIVLLVIITIGVVSWVIYRYVIHQPGKDEYDSTDYFEEDDDLFS